jgi:hypothetical protein
MRRDTEDFDKLPVSIEEATIRIKAFARDVLSVQICGPGRPQL